jgi:hypothetical protein
LNLDELLKISHYEDGTIQWNDVILILILLGKGRILRIYSIESK